MPGSAAGENPKNSARERPGVHVDIASLSDRGIGRVLTVPRLGHVGGEDAELSTGFDIQAPVADDCARREIDVPVVPGLTEQQRAGLSALAVCFGDVGAVVERIDPGSIREQQLVQSFVNTFDVESRVEASLHSRLIRHTDHEVAVVVGEREGIPHAPEQFDPLGLLEVAEVRIQGAVPVHEEGSSKGTEPDGRAHHVVHSEGEAVGGIRVQPRMSFCRPMEPPREEIQDLRTKLDSALDGALGPLRTSSGRLGILFSGGVDSALLAWELRTRPEVVLCTLGREGSPDLRAGRTGAVRLGLPWQPLAVDPVQLTAAAARFEKEFAGVSRVTREVLVSLALAIEQAGPDRLVCGQGADELFFGYAHYRDLIGAEVERRSIDDLNRLRESDWPRTQRIAEKAGKEIVAPYLSRAFEEAALRVPVDLRLPGNQPKRFFREWALGRGLPAELSDRPKKALQYGTGVSTLLRKQARSGR